MRLGAQIPEIGISDMSNVEIPETYFLSSVKLQYSCPDAAIVREVVQNSIDAYATRIQMTVTEDGVFEIDDDGQGMSEERMVAALLTFGGSEKDGIALGGLGEAKIAILFAHAHYFVHSRDNLVHGRVLRYELTKGEFRKGTLIRIKFHPEYKFDYQCFLNAAREVLRQSEFSIPVTLNGRSEEATQKGRCVRSFTWGKVHCSKLDGQTSYYALVRSGGLFMFRHYIGATSKSVIVEVSGNPREMFVGSRDRLADVPNTELQALFNELVVDRTSFGRKVNEKILFSGDKGAIDDLLPDPVVDLGDRLSLAAVMDNVVAQMRATMEEAAPQVKSAGRGQSSAIQRAEVVLHRVVEQMPIKPDQRAFIQSKARAIAAHVCRHTYDFLIHIENTRYSKIPDRYRPSNLSAKNRYLAQLWKHCVKLALRANGINSRFRIGWVLNDSESALRVPGGETDNIPAYLLNPDFHALRERSKNRKSIFLHLFQIACHEVTHNFHRWHDEAFGARLGTVIENTMMEMNTWRHHCRAAKQEIL